MNKSNTQKTNPPIKNSEYEKLHAKFMNYMENKQFKEILDWMNEALKENEYDFYYRWRALAISRNGRPFLEDYYHALEDANRALELNYCENNLILKWQILSVLDGAHANFGIRWESYYCLDNNSEEICIEEPLDNNTIEKHKLSEEPKPLIPEDKKKYITEEKLKTLYELIKLTDKLVYYKEMVKSIIYQAEANLNNLLLEKLQQVYQDISHHIDYENNAEWYNLKREIEVKLEKWDEALLSTEKAYQDDNNLESYLQHKYEIYLQSKDYHKAIDVIEQMIKNFPPTFVNPSDIFETNIHYSYARKLELLFITEQYDKYTKELFNLYKQGLRICLSYYLQKLIQIKQYNAILNNLDEVLLANQVIGWFALCSYIEINNNAKASKIIDNINFDTLLEEVANLYSFSLLKRFDYVQIYDDSYINLLFSSLNWQKMSDLLYIRFLAKLFEKGICDWSPQHNIITKYLEIKSPNYKFKEVAEELDTFSNNPDDLKVKLELLRYTYQEIDKDNKVQSYLPFIRGLDNQLCNLIFKENEKKIMQAKLDERNRILANLSHSIKNLLKAVIDPLINLREDVPEKGVVIDNAIKGANLIREIVNAINYSYTTSLEDLRWDISHPDKERMSLQDMIYDSLKYSISNMFDFRYFSPFALNYFASTLSNEEFKNIQNNWKTVSENNSKEALVKFAENYLFLIDIFIDESGAYLIGNSKSSAIKMMILFQEIIFNAVKYVSYIPRENRIISITLKSDIDKLIFSVKNRFNPNITVKTTGIGNLLIDNFAKALNCISEVKTDKQYYSVSLEFMNLWRNNG